jgi:hypothetical protein
MSGRCCLGQDDGNGILRAANSGSRNRDHAAIQSGARPGPARPKASDSLIKGRAERPDRRHLDLDRRRAPPEADRRFACTLRSRLVAASRSWSSDGRGPVRLAVGAARQSCEPMRVTWRRRRLSGTQRKLFQPITPCHKPLGTWSEVNRQVSAPDRRLGTFLWIMRLPGPASTEFLSEVLAPGTERVVQRPGRCAI